MKIEQLLNEHKKGVKAVKYARKPQPVIGPEAQKKKAKAKVHPPKTELEKHSKLTSKLESITEIDKSAPQPGRDGRVSHKTYGSRDTEGERGTQHTVKPQKAKDAVKDAEKIFNKTKIKEQGVAEGSAQEKLHQRHQELRKKSGLPDPDYYKELKATYDLPDEERQKKTKELKNKYNIKESRKKQEYNFDIEDIKKLELIKDMPTLKAQAMGLISKPSAKPMKPEKVAWFDAAIDRMDSKIQIIKLMYDLLLSGEGHQVIGTKWSTDPNSYRRRFGEGINEAKRPDRPPPETDLKVGDDVVADTSKEDYPGGHKERRGKVTRVGQKGVHIKTDDSDEPEWHPYKIVKKRETSMKEAKQSETPKPRNFVAKNAKTVGAGKHKDEKKASKEIRGQKHKNKEMAESGLQYSIGVDKHGKDYMVKAAKLMRSGGSQEELGRLRDKESKAYKNKKESIAETYYQARAARIRYALMLKESDWDIQSDEMIPPEYDMDPEELKAIRNAEFTEQDKIQAMIKLAAGGTSDEDIAKIYDMDKETVASILDDYIEEIEAETDQDADMKETTLGKVVDYKPGVSATIDTGPGMSTMLDLKKNPTSLTKDPQTGKLKLIPGTAATAQPSATTQSTVKPGDQVEMPKIDTMAAEDLLRLAGLK